MFEFLEKMFDKAWLYWSWSYEKKQSVRKREVILRGERQRFYRILNRYRDLGGMAPTNLELWWKLVEEETGLITKINYTGLKPGRFERCCLLAYRGENNFVALMRDNLSAFERRITEAHESAHVIFDFYWQDGKVKSKSSTAILCKLAMQTHELFIEKIAGVILCMPHEIDRYLRENNRFPTQLNLFFRRKLDNKFIKKMAKAFDVPPIFLRWQLRRQYGALCANSLLLRKI